MSILMWILASTFLVSLIAFIGILSFAVKERTLKKVLLILIALSAGALIGGAFLHLIPESAERLGDDSIFIYVLVGFIFFFLLEKILHWRHCHNGKCRVHTIAYMNLIGDGAHNFIDGLIIAAGFLMSIPLGITTTLAVAFHEIPQEIGDFGVLIYAGFKKSRALFLNFAIALTSILGGVAGYFLSNYIENSAMFVLPFAAGGFIYIAASDLIPELHKEKNIRKSFLSFAFFIIGVLLMYAIKLI